MCKNGPPWFLGAELCKLISYSSIPVEIISYPPTRPSYLNEADR